jgi:hypothetical protein
MRIPSGVTDQYIYFVAVDATDYATRETGLSSFTVYRSRNGAAAAAMTTPTINETDTTNMPGVYELLLDEDMTIGSGNDSEEMCFHITHAGMAPVTRTIELYRPKITAGNTLGVASDGDISGNLDGTVATVTTLTGHTAQTGDTYALANGATGFTAIDTVVDGIKAKTDSLTFTVANQLDSNILSISGDGTAADNLELDYDGTGYNKSNSTIGTCTTNTDMLTNAGIADAVFDEATSGHNTAGTYGRIFRQLHEGVISVEASVNDVSATTTSFVTNLAEADNDHYNDLTLMFIDGALKGQAKPISDYNGGTKTVTLDEALTEAPGNGDSFIILALHVHPTSQIASAVTTDIDANSTKLASIETDTQDIQNRLPAALTAGGHMASSIEAIVNDATAAANLQDSALGIVRGQCSGVPTTTSIPSNLTETTVDHYVNRVVVFLTGDAAGSAGRVEGYASNGTLTISAVVTAPISGDDFVIV